MPESTANLDFGDAQLKKIEFELIVTNTSDCSHFGLRSEKIRWHVACTLAGARAGKEFV
jgi:hypothetical protein